MLSKNKILLAMFGLNIYYRSFMLFLVFTNICHLFLHPREIKDQMVPQGHQEKLDLEYVKDDSIQ